MKSEPPAMDGTQRAAVFLMTLGEEAASQVLKLLEPREVQNIGTAMASVPNVTKSQLNEVVDSFHASLEEQTAIGMGSEDYMRKVLVRSIGEDRANSLIDRILVRGSTTGLESLKWMDARSVADMIKNEHPQIVAIVLSYLDSDQSAEVLTFFPERMRSDTVHRIALLESINPSALEELDKILEQQFAGSKGSKAPVVGGLKRAADILNLMDSASESQILEQIREHDDTLGSRIQELMFTFENLLELDDRSVQRLLREVANEQLVAALKGAPGEIKALVLRNMSKRAAEALEEDLEAKGPMRVSEVEAAQKEILAVVRQLVDDGEVVLGGKGGDDYI